MDVQTLRAFFLWCTLLNGALLAFSALLLTFAGGWVYRLHSRWYPMPRETFNAAIYGMLGLFKILVFVFNLVPYLALRIIG
jgi:hypothetical protein